MIVPPGYPKIASAPSRLHASSAALAPFTSVSFRLSKKPLAILLGEGLSQNQRSLRLRESCSPPDKDCKSKAYDEKDRAT
jgi:hypothetical protein